METPRAERCLPNERLRVRFGSPELRLSTRSLSPGTGLTGWSSVFFCALVAFELPLLKEADVDAQH
jgi:hypothetical protein